ncbi:MAG: hypothetical protein M3268_01720 [Acidobacteriota bacterium]|nr:hypothetical protein [Acidobacteriota bacterium]
MLEQSILYDFRLAGRRVRLWKRAGESYEHVLMKALGFAMYAREFPGLEVEPEVGLRYTPDLLARRDEAEHRGARFPFWGECGQTTVRKIGWLLKHADVGRLVLFKMVRSPHALSRELRADIESRYRDEGRLRVINFSSSVVSLAADRKIDDVPESWYTEIVV